MREGREETRSRALRRRCVDRFHEDAALGDAATVSDRSKSAAPDCAIAQQRYGESCKGRPTLLLVGVTVGELLAIPHLRLRLHSGSPGLDREVTWTHTSDLPEPWQWVGRGELLMTNGMSFPTDAEDQVHLLERLSGVGVSGLAIGERMYCPNLTDRFAQVSDELALPILWIAYPMPFVAISRAVAEATLLEQSQRLIRTARIYDTLRRTTGRALDGSAVAEALSAELRTEVFVCDRESGAAYHPDGPHPGARVVEAVRLAGAGGAALIAGARSVIVDDEHEVLVADIPTHDQAVLAVKRPAGLALDGILLQHAATVAALELSQTKLGLEHKRRAGAEATAQLLDGRTDHRSARRLLLDAGLDPERSVLACLGDASQERLRETHVRLWRTRIPHILALREAIVHAFVPDTTEAVTGLVAAVGPGGHVGVSGHLRMASRAAEAGREGLWALGAARQSGAPMQRFGDATELTGSGSLEDDQSLVDQVLGPLLRHDADNQSDLLPTLATFLDHRRSWQATAEAMHVHRQTVLYRIKRIERLTGRSLADTETVAVMWLALRARARLTGGDKPPG